jgi:transposase-like protein
LTAGTIMHATRTPLQVWFWGAYLVTTQTPGMSALQFQRQLGIRRYETAFQLLHKLRAGMVRPDADRIGGDWPVEVDETLIGGKTRGEGRGVHHKIYVIGAVEAREKLDKRGRRSLYAGRLRLRALDDRAGTSLETFVAENVVSPSRVTTDGWSGYSNLTGLGYRHEAVVLDGDMEKAEQALPMIHLVFSNLKAWLLGTHHGVSQKHLPAYLNEFVFRFNRRFYPMTAFATVLGIGMNVAGPTYRGLYDGQWDHRARSSATDPL